MASRSRFVAATNRDLEAMLLRGEFREDLYYRLKVIEVTVPPLRERRGEISHLTQFFIDRYARRYNRPVRQLTDELQKHFLTYEWPGNIRELENMIKRIVILQDESLVIREMQRNPRAALAVASVANSGNGRPAAPAQVSDDVDDLDGVDAAGDEPAMADVAAVVAPASSKLADIAKSAAMKAERTIIEDTLHQVHWNRRRAAEQLGVSYKTLLNKIKECGISRA